MTIPSRLIEQLAEGRVVSFVGSGVSLAVRVDDRSVFPSWGGLLADMADELIAVGNEDDAAIVRRRTGQELKTWELDGFTACCFTPHPLYRGEERAAGAKIQPARFYLTI